MRELSDGGAPLLMLRGVLLFWAAAFLLGTVAASWVGDRIA